MFILVLILGYLGFVLYSNRAEASPVPSNLSCFTDQVSGVHLQ